MRNLPPVPKDRPLDPLADSFIKYLFGSPERAHLLKDLINAVFLDSGRPPVVSVEILNPYTQKDLEVQREIYLDVKALDQEGRILNVEIQRWYEKDFAARSLYYWAATYYRQMKKGQPYAVLRPVITFNLLDFVLFPSTERPHSSFSLLCNEDPEICLTGNQEMHFIEVPKVLKRIKDLEKGLRDKLNAWCYYLRGASQNLLWN